MNLAPILARIAEAELLGESQVAIAVSVESALEQVVTPPFAWLCEVRGQSDPNQTCGGGVYQDHKVRFGVLCHVAHVGDMRGAGAAALMEQLRQQVWAKLLGFKPAADYAPLEHRRDLLADWQAGKLWWLDDYETYHNLSSEQ